MYRGYSPRGSCPGPGDICQMSPPLSTPFPVYLLSKIKATSAEKISLKKPKCIIKKNKHKMRITLNIPPPQSNMVVGASCYGDPGQSWKKTCWRLLVETGGKGSLSAGH
ncbi:hypothetical protein XENORESO_002796 [Xenotaenia resolanae]|uniref:Uncharacterized protein n=1 Tax=Xenotaenia resolanae TaxID=208358 RepID=A0ABV0W7D0_9TELE